MRQSRPPQADYLIDWDNPITRDLLFSYSSSRSLGAFMSTHNEQIGRKIEFVKPTVGAATIGRTLVPGVGVATTFSGSHLGLAFPKFDGLLSTTALTVIARVQHDSSGTNEHCIISNWEGSTGKQGFMLRIEPANDSLEWHINQNSDGETVLNSSANFVPPNEPVHVAAVYDVLGEGNMRSYANGIRNSGTTSVTDHMGDMQSSTGRELYLGISPHNTADKLIGWILECHVFNRVVPDPQIVSLYHNPWQIYRPPRRRMALSTGAIFAITSVGGDDQFDTGEQNVIIAGTGFL